MKCLVFTFKADINAQGIDVLYFTSSKYLVRGNCSGIYATGIHFDYRRLLN